MNLDSLTPEFRLKAQAVIDECNRLGVTMRPFFCIRTPREQAKLWRQSRTTAQIDTALEMLRDHGALYLTECLEQAGPQHGKWATNALPGLSWHNWGQAVDCFVVNPDGTACWDTEHVGYRTYAAVARDMGLTAGYFWASGKQDAVHIQLPKHEVLEQMAYADVDKEMKQRFGA